MVLNILLLTLGLYFIQEAQAQRANPDFHFFVPFPQPLLPLAYAAVLLLLPNFAIIAITIKRRLWKRRWPWVTTALAAVLLLVVAAKIGPAGVWAIISP